MRRWWSSTRCSAGTAHVPHPDSPACVVSVSRDAAHRFSKPAVEEITLVEDWGVEGDAHAGRTVRHRSHRARDPQEPNLRQVHLLHEEVLDDVAVRGFRVAPGEMGENVTTRGVLLLTLPVGTVLDLGPDASVELTGLRNPCVQIDALAPGLMRQMVGRDARGDVVRRAGVMAVVRSGGVVRPGDPVTVRLPAGPHRPLGPV
jgi:MOSC domain-containing protein YiiM